ncbi:MAG: hydroxymethylglutaryl-CoA lyase, partial [Acidobacteria bacterium]|nr:hydroxymethylglutaryl-CoA lyase [Acidobacteriota bacterium]
MITICDVGPRDGLQNEPESLDAHTRAELVNRLAAAGLPRVEAASFVREDAVPQMAGAEEVVKAIERREGTEYSGLALNQKGYERLVASGLDRVNFTFAVTETFNLRNGNRSLADAQAGADAVLAQSSLPVTLTLSCSFGDPFEGRVDPGAVAAIVEHFDGRAEIVLADTIGVATPS